ncbi:MULTISPECIES: HAD family hydrolase [unclassified Campylobacter]|uniref:HAD family hydrolase n=1 Tax=unclassified Campylobacter TaxID=2593542 RepID=UPI003D354C92
MIKNIIFDFDGVVINSMPIRGFGFRKIFENFDKEQVDKLIEFHNQNGGLSRFIKIRYFYESILNSHIGDDEVLKYAEKFSQIMKKMLCNKKILIQDTVDFILSNYDKFNMHIVSGSEENELNFLCKKLEIYKYFKTIQGSPTIKQNILMDILDKFSYQKNETILIGDSINDYDAAVANKIEFYGFNNIVLKKYSKTYIDSFKNLDLMQEFGL